MTASLNADPKHTLYLVDISSFIFRAFYAIRSLTTKSGEPVNAVYGVATMLARLAEEAAPEYLAVVYDSKEPSFREELYPEYKAHRAAPPEELIPQFARIEELIRCLGIHSYRQSGVEADDLIATLSKRWHEASPKNQVVIVSSDKDLMQLVNDRVRTWDTMSGKVYRPSEVLEKFGVEPAQIRDYLGLVGDSSDNIPGVPGVGPKTAADLLKEWGDLEGVIQAAKSGKIPGKKGQALVEHEKDARLSAELATVKQDLKIQLPLEELKYHFHITPGCEKFLAEMEFHSLAAKWTQYKPTTLAAPAIQPGSSPRAEFKAIQREEDLDRVLERIERKGEFGFDIESTSLNPLEAKLVGIALCCDPEESFYIPLAHRGTSGPQLKTEYVLEKLRPFLSSGKFRKIGQNLKYDMSVMARQGVPLEGLPADTMVAAYVLNPEGRHNLELLASQYLDYQVTTYEQVCGKGKDQLCFDEIPIDQATRYSAEDAWIALKLWRELLPRIEKENLGDLLNRVDLPMVGVLARMEESGVYIDVPWLQKLSRGYEKELAAIQERIHAYAQGTVNLNSPKQLGQLLFEQLKLPVQSKTKTGYSTDASVLEALSPLHEVPRLLLEYREISKLKGTYVDPLPDMRDADGKIHASFHQTVAATGRLSSSDPNLQNIPIRTERGRSIRRAFVASEGNVLVAADYSQIELRLLAHMSGDVELTRSFQKDEDVHRRTASEIFGVGPEKVDDRQRSIAKAINFGLMYGKSAFSLAQELKISRREAADIIHRYFERYTGVKHYLDQAVLQAKESGVVYSLLGRRRPLADIRSKNPGLRGNAERMAMNTPIQASAADLMKLAMIEIDRRLSEGKFKSKLTIQVHDEVVLDCPRSEAESVKTLVIEVMESAMKLSVPLRVNAGVAVNWLEV